jgi:hypothetical protein
MNLDQEVKICIHPSGTESLSRRQLLYFLRDATTAIGTSNRILRALSRLHSAAGIHRLAPLTLRRSSRP